MECARQTLELTEHIDMLATRKRMTLMYRVLMAWSTLTRRNKLEESLQSEDSIETHNARMRFKELQNKKSIDLSS